MRKVYAECQEAVVEGFVSRHADLDSVVTIIECDTGKPVRVNGWLWSFEFEGED